MKALSLHRPWAELIACELKRIETRDWLSLPKCLLGQRIAIHAAKRIDATAVERIRRDTGLDVSHVALSPGGCIVATARVHAVEWLDGSPYEVFRALCACRGLVGIHLTEVRRVRPPRPFRGHQRIFNVPDDLLLPCPRNPQPGT